MYSRYLSKELNIKIFVALTTGSLSRMGNILEIADAVQKGLQLILRAGVQHACKVGPGQYASVLS